MKITLIEPAMIKKPLGLSEKPIFCFQPLAQGLLAGLTPPGIDVEVIDDRFETIIYDPSPDLVGISVKTFTARRSYQIAAKFREQGVPVILGGHHVTLLPEEAVEHADAIFIGEADLLWEKVVDDVLHKQLQAVYNGGREERYPPVKFNRAVLNKKRYLPAATVESARGCPFNCSFCSVSTFFGQTLRRRAVGELVDEIRAAGRPTVLFVDDNIVGEVESAKELFQALIPLKIRWMSQASISMAQDLELMNLMSKSGCAGVLVGFESLLATNLKMINKTWNTARQDYVQSLQIAREFNISIVGSFIIGLDNDTPESLDEILDFAVRQKMFAVLFNMLIPFPGTDLYRQMEREGRLRYRKWWLDPAYTYGEAVYNPLHFSAGQLAIKRMEMYKKFYGPASILKRSPAALDFLRDPWRSFIYLLMNLPGYRQEMQRFGKHLGSYIL